LKQLLVRVRCVVGRVATEQKPTSGLKHLRHDLVGSKQLVATEQKPTSGLKRKRYYVKPVEGLGRDGAETHIGIETRFSRLRVSSTQVATEQKPTSGLKHEDSATAICSTNVATEQKPTSGLKHRCRTCRMV